MSEHKAERNKMEKISRGIIGGVSVLFLLLLSVLNLCFTADVAYDQSERVRISNDLPLDSILIGVLIVGMLFGVVRICDKLAAKGKFREIWLYIIFCGIYLLAGGWLIGAVGEALREDPLHVYETAREFAEGDYRALETGGYIFRKLHQLGLVTYERILGLISPNVKFIFWVNLLLVNGINYFIYKLADMIFVHNRRVNVITICLSYFFLPQFFFVVFAYGLIPGFFFMLLGIWFMEKYFMEKKQYQWVLSIVCVSVAVLLKSNYLIAGITLAILCFLQFLKKRELGLLVIALLIVIVPVGAQKVLPAIYHLETGLEINEGEPMLTYVAMGINPMNEGRGPGWYDGSNYMWYQDTGYDNEATTQKAKDCIENCFWVYRQDPVGSAKFFMRKIASQWCEPLFQSVWSGPLATMGQQVETESLQKLYRGEGMEPALRIWMKSLLLLVNLLATMYLVVKRKEKHGTEFAFVFFVGGFLFHLFWEAKSQYIYPYVFVLLPSCAWMVAYLYEKLTKVLSKNMGKIDSEN